VQHNSPGNAISGSPEADHYLPTWHQFYSDGGPCTSESKEESAQDEEMIIIK